MDSILVEVYLPATQKAYDIRIPRLCMMWEVTELVSKALSELSEGLYNATDKAVLCDRVNGTLYNINLSVEELGLTNGSRLMLI